MAKVVSLRRTRKDQARQKKRAIGDANAAKHGLTKAERARQTLDATRAKATLDGAKREE